jgi:hypothetical protein
LFLTSPDYEFQFTCILYIDAQSDYAVSWTKRHVLKLTSFVEPLPKKCSNVSIRSPIIFTDKKFMIILKMLLCLSKENEDWTLSFVLKTNYDVLLELEAYLYEIIAKCLSIDKALPPFSYKRGRETPARTSFPHYRKCT